MGEQAAVKCHRVEKSLWWLPAKSLSVVHSRAQFVLHRRPSITSGAVLIATAVTHSNSRSASRAALIAMHRRRTVSNRFTLCGTGCRRLMCSSTLVKWTRRERFLTLDWLPKARTRPGRPVQTRSSLVHFLSKLVTIQSIYWSFPLCAEQSKQQHWRSHRG